MRLAIAAALVAAALPAAAQTIYRCTGDGGKVTYQEVPCEAKAAQRRVEPGPSRESVDAIEARRALERDHYYRGSELSGRFAGDARDKERERYLQEQREREERARRAREEAQRVAPEDVPWNPPWGFPGRPGQALPKKPASSS